VPSPTTFPPEQLTALRDRIIARFDIEELRLLVFDLDDNNDDLPVRTINGKMQALPAHLNMLSLLSDLIGHRKKLLAHFKEMVPRRIDFSCKIGDSAQRVGIQQVYSPIILFCHSQPRSASMVADLCAAGPIRRAPTLCRLTSLAYSTPLPNHDHSPEFTPVGRGYHSVAEGRPELHSTASLNGKGGDQLC
jgi:hypothetical protein